MGSTTTKGRARRYLSSVPFVAVHLACGLAVVYPPTWHLALLAVGSYLLRMWAITVGYHRYLSHRSFRTGRAFQFVLALLGATAMQQGPLWWASWHRRHHDFADTPADPHSPVVREILLLLTPGPSCVSFPTMQTLDAFDRQFPTEEACRDYLVQKRWPEGVRCPRCGARRRSMR